MIKRKKLEENDKNQSSQQAEKQDHVQRQIESETRPAMVNVAKWWKRMEREALVTNQMLRKGYRKDGKKRDSPGPNIAWWNLWWKRQERRERDKEVKRDFIMKLEKQCSSSSASGTDTEMCRVSDIINERHSVVLRFKNDTPSKGNCVDVDPGPPINHHRGWIDFTPERGAKSRVGQLRVDCIAIQ